MSIFAKLSKTERAIIFSGAEFSASKMPSGTIMLDGSIFSTTKEGYRTFKMVSCPSGKAIYGAKAVWRCDLTLNDSPRIAERAF